MDNNQIEVLVKRISRLERICVRWRRAVTVSWFAALLVLILGAGQRGGAVNSIVTQDITVVDEKGRALIRLGPDAEGKGKAVLEFFDSKGERRIVVGVDDAGAPYVSLTDGDAGDQLVLDVQPQGGSAVAFRNRRSRSGLLLAADPTGVSALGLMDKEGNRLVELGLNPNGSGRFTIRSKDGKNVFEVP